MNKLFKTAGIGLSLLLAAGVALAQSETPEEASPAAVVERLHAALIEAMSGAERLGFDGRVALLEPVLSDSFDFETIARIVTGAAWKEASEEQKDQFLRTFAALSTSTYASNFDSFAGQHFETVSSTEARRGQIVKTHLVASDGTKIPFNYMLRKSDSGWRIVNVIAQGISDLSLKRAEYAAVIKSSGFGTLLSLLDEKVRGLQNVAN
ncbi:MAG: ABC transporter substrate-binding protein [Pseudomonadota bacterium]